MMQPHRVYAKVGGEYADPSMRLVLIPTDTPDEATLHSLEGGRSANGATVQLLKMARLCQTLLKQEPVSNHVGPAMTQLSIWIL